MSHMMYRALVIVVLVGIVLCENSDEDAETITPTIASTVRPDGNRTSSVVIVNKVKNSTADYKHYHSQRTNTSYVVRPPSASSNNNTEGKPLIISTSKEVRLIQIPSKLNDSIALPTTKSNNTQRHPNSITRKNNINNHKKDEPRHPLPTIKPTVSTTVRPKLQENVRVFEDSRSNITNNLIGKPPGQNYAYSYFRLSQPKSSVKLDTGGEEPKNLKTVVQLKNYEGETSKNVQRKSIDAGKPKNKVPLKYNGADKLINTVHLQNIGGEESKNNSSDIDVEQMKVKEMRSVEDRKENMKLSFYFVGDGDDTDSDDKPTKSIITSIINEKVTGQNQGSYYQQKPTYNKEKTGHSKPYHDDSVPKKYGGVYNSQSAHLKSTKLVPVTTLRPGHHHRLNISKISNNPLGSYRRANASTLNLVKDEDDEAPARDFSCLHCVGNGKGAKQHKHPTYPSKNEQSPVDDARAVKLQGPDGDSILGDSKHHYTLVKVAEFVSNSSGVRIPKNGLTNHKEQQNPMEQKGRRKPFMGLDNAGSYSSHVGGSVEYRQKPNHFSLDTGSRTKKPDMSDLYNLDELESSGSSKSHVKYETKEIHIPYAVRVEKKVSYPIHIKVDRPVPVHIDKPYPVHVEKKVPVPVKVHVPQPYPVEKEVPYPVKIPIEVPRPVEVAKPVPYIVEKPVPIQVIKEVKFPVKVPVDVPVPYKVPVHVEKRVPYFVEKKVPFEVPVPVEKPYFVEIKKPFEVPNEKPHPVTVEKKIPVPMQVIEFVKVPIPVKVPVEGYSEYLHRSSSSHDSQEKEDGKIGVEPAPKHEDTSEEKSQLNESKLQHRMGTVESDSDENEQKHSVYYRLPQMISIEFSHPDMNQEPRVRSLSEDSEEQDDADSENPST